MRGKWTHSIMMSVLLLASSGALIGQPEPRKAEARKDGLPPKRPERWRGGTDRDPARGIELVKLYAMIEALDLSDEQCMKVFPVMSQINKDRRQVAEEREQILMELRRMADDPNVMEAEMAQKIKAMEDVSSRATELDKRFSESLKPLLSVKQQAELVLFQNEFDRRLGEIIGRVRGEGGPPGDPDRARRREPGPGDPDMAPPPQPQP